MANSAAYMKAYWDKLRKDVLQAYGNKCVCCGETTSRFLTIDHVYGDGASDRNRTGSGLYRTLRAAGFPKDRHRLLCYNCNCGRGQFGECLHAEVYWRSINEEN